MSPFSCLPSKVFISIACVVAGVVTTGCGSEPSQASDVTGREHIAERQDITLPPIRIGSVQVWGERVDRNYVRVRCYGRTTWDRVSKRDFSLGNVCPNTVMATAHDFIRAYGPTGSRIEVSESEISAMRDRLKREALAECRARAELNAHLCVVESRVEYSRVDHITGSYVYADIFAVAAATLPREDQR